MTLDIAEVARHTGIAASTLRFYEAKGLIVSVGRRGLRRLFAPAVLDRLALIALARTAGFSLEEIAAMFLPDGRVHLDPALLQAKIAEIDRTIDGLREIRGHLQHAAVCTAPSHMECPTFRRHMQSAAVARRGAKPRATR